MKPLKILIFAAFYHPFRGGYVESIHGLARALVQKGHSITIVTPFYKEAPATEFMDGVEIIRLPSWHILNRTYPLIIPNLRTFRILKKLWKRPFDIVSTQTRFFVTSFLGTFFALTRRLPLIHTERGAFHSIVPNRIINGISQCIDHTLGFIVVRCAKHNVGVSQAACDFLNHLHARKISRIPNGINLIPLLSKEEKNKLREKWGFKPHDLILLFVGHLIYAKGLQDVFAILTDLISLKPNLKLAVVADGPYRKFLEVLAQNLNIQKHIVFLGTLKAKEVMECLQMADVLVNPSHSEGLPRSVLEAAAAGLPIVASDVGGTREIILHGKTGFLFPSQDKNSMKSHLRKIFKDEQLALSLGQNARDHIQSFNWPQIVQSYEDLFQELLKK
ncbi:MAG: glycosyltransferase family 4 protein [Candidatus Gracilibacteria bacterium]